MISGALGLPPMCPPWAMQHLFFAISRISHPPSQWLLYLAQHACLDALETPVLEKPYLRTQRLFDIEPDNFYAEEVFVRQLSLCSIKEILAGSSDTSTKLEILQLIKPHAGRIISRLVSTFQWLRDTQKSAYKAWPQWITFEEDVFKQLCRAINAPCTLVLVAKMMPETSEERQWLGAIKEAALQAKQLASEISFHPLLQQCFAYLCISSGVSPDDCCKLPFHSLPELFLLPHTIQQ